MLPIEKCRRILGPDCPLTDDEILVMRDHLRQVALVAMRHAATPPTDADDGPTEP